MEASFADRFVQPASETEEHVAFLDNAPPPTGVLPQASQGLDKSIIQVNSRHLVQKGSVELLREAVETQMKVKKLNHK